MKRKLIILTLLSLFLLCLASCGGLKIGSTSEHVTDTVKGASMTVTEFTPISAVYTITNETGYEICSGNAHSIVIEVNQKGAWHQIEIGEHSNTAEALIISNGEKAELKTTWSGTYGTLPKGQYRLLKGFWSDSLPGNHILSAEFEID